MNGKSAGRPPDLDYTSYTRLDSNSIADPKLRKQLVSLLKPLNGGKEIKAALTEFSARTGIRRVLLEERLSVIPIKDRRTHKPYRYVKGDSNYCYEIFRHEDGGWGGEVISTFSANQKSYRETSSVAENGEPLIMRIHRGDVLAIEQNDERRIMRVAKFSAGRIALAEHNEANVDARARNNENGFKYMVKSPSALKALRARIIGVDILGYVNDPGFRE